MQCFGKEQCESRISHLVRPLKWADGSWFENEMDNGILYNCGRRIRNEFIAQEKEILYYSEK